MPIRPTGTQAPRQPVLNPGDSNPAGSSTEAETSRNSAPAFGDEFAGGIKTTHPQARKALDAYQDTVRKILNHDAESLARGQSPVRAGDTLSGDQAKAMQEATVELFENLPLDALSPKMAEKAKGFLRRRGIENVDDLGDKPIKDLAPYGSELAKRMASQFKESHPGAYYGLGAGLAAGIGYKAYQDGSDFLKDLGIKPEFKKTFFDDALIAKAKGSWGAKATDVHINSDLEYRTNLGEDTKAKLGVNGTFKGGTLGELEMTRLRVRSSVDRQLGEDLNLNLNASTTAKKYSDGFKVFEHEAGAKLSHDALDFGAKSSFDAEGSHKGTALDLTFRPERSRIGLGTDLGADGSIEHYRLSGRYKHEGLTLSGKGKWDQNFDLESARLSARYKVGGASDLNVGGSAVLGSGGDLQKASADLLLSRGDWTYRGSLNRDVKTGASGAELSAGYRKGNLEFFGVGGHDQDRGNYVGAGLTFRF